MVIRHEVGMPTQGAFSMIVKTDGTKAQVCMLSCPGAGEGAGLAQPVLGGVLAAAGHSAAGGGAAGGPPQDRDTARPLHPHDGAHHLHLLHHRQVAPHC